MEIDFKSFYDKSKIKIIYINKQQIFKIKTSLNLKSIYKNKNFISE